MVKRLFIFLGGILSALLLSEISLHIFFPQPVYSRLYDDEMDCYESHPLYYVDLRKNATCFYAPTQKEYTTKTQTNNAGFREKKPTQTLSSPGTKRIVFIGDSFTFGQGVQSEEAFPKIVEKKFREKHIPVETINAGIVGAGPEWYYLTLKEKIIPLKPDVVVVTLYLGNDLSDTDYFEWKDLDKNGLPTKITTEYEYIDADGSRRFSNTPNRYRIPLLRDSHLNIFLANVFFGSHTNNTKEIAFTGSPCYLSPDCNDYAGQEKKLNQLVVGMKKLAIQHKIQLVITLIPWELQLKHELLQHSGITILVTEKRRYLLSNRIKKMLQKNGILTLDLLPVFDAYSGNKQIVYPLDRHWTKEGHRIAGEAVTDALTPLLNKSTKENPSVSTSSGQM